VEVPHEVQVHRAVPVPREVQVRVPQPYEVRVDQPFEQIQTVTRDVHVPQMIQRQVPVPRPYHAGVQQVVADPLLNTRQGMVPYNQFLGDGGNFAGQVL
jgi:hypothetical protein